MSGLGTSSIREKGNDAWMAPLLAFACLCLWGAGVVSKLALGCKMEGRECSRRKDEQAKVNGTRNKSFQNLLGVDLSEEFYVRWTRRVMVTTMTWQKSNFNYRVSFTLIYF